jgi:hypothetical protein
MKRASEQRAASKERLCLLASLLLAACYLLGSCVSLEQLPPGALSSIPGQTTATAATFPDLDPGATSLTTLHFTFKGYTETEIRPISLMAESLYNKIGNDTGLYAFLASGNYTIVIYRDRDEYLQKTHLPEWSRAVTAGSAIYVYPGPDLEPVLAHEMTHLIFNSYMTDKAVTYKWFNEGLAMVEEVAKMTDTDRAAFQSSALTQLRQTKMPFSQMTFFIPNTEERRRVDAWYQQVQSVVAFMLAQGSALNFANMLNQLRSGSDIDRALADNYPGKFHSLNELENAWKYTL